MKQLISASMPSYSCFDKEEFGGFGGFIFYHNFILIPEVKRCRNEILGLVISSVLLNMFQCPWAVDIRICLHTEYLLRDI